MEKLKTYEEYCMAFKGSDDQRRLAEILLYLRSYIANIRMLDSKEQGYITTNALISCSEKDLTKPADYISAAARKTAKVFQHIVDNLRTNIVHENVMMPIYKAREFNSTSIGWLSRQPGRNIREKLASSHSVLAVRRRMSVDTGENRLLKEFAKRLEDGLFLKQKQLPEKLQNTEELFLYESLRRFRELPEFKEILPWRNTPPNNTLLSDKKYNVIWRSWNDLAKINNQLQADQAALSQRLVNLAMLLLIRILGKCCRFPQLPIRYCYDGQELSQLTGFEVYNDFAIQLPFKEIQAMGPGNNKLILAMVTDVAGIKLSYRGMQAVLTFKGMQATQQLSNNNSQVLELTASSIEPILKQLAAQLLGEDYIESAALTADKQLTAASPVCLDIFHLCPTIWQDGKTQAYKGQLLQQELHLADRTYLLDCGSVESVLEPDGVQVSALTIKNVIDSAMKNEIVYLKNLVDSLHQQVTTEQLNFLYPESYNEFQLVSLKRAVKMYYHQVNAYPRSLAAIFTFVKEKQFQQDFCAGDIVLVVDREASGISVTMVRSLSDDLVKQVAPEIRGIVWEHHPAKFYADTRNSQVKALADGDIQAEAKDLLYWNQHTGAWHNKKQLPSSIEARADINAAVQDYCLNHGNFINGQHVWIITLGDNIKINNKIYRQLNYKSASILAGIEYYQQCEQKIKRPIWRDCLPDLAIRRLFGKFDLVKNSTFAYGEKLMMDIPVASTFTLPKEQLEYHFQLLMDSSNDMIPYQAVIRNRKFPLHKDVTCRLQMKYTYGADEPYSLQFVPLNKAEAGFNEANVSWERLERYSIAGNQYPDYPPADTWKHLQEWPSLKFGGTFDISERLLNTTKSVIAKWYSADDDWKNKKLNFILFCFHSTYANGRFVKMDDCPLDYRNRVKEALIILYRFYQELTDHEKIESRIFNMLCIAGLDVDEGFFADALAYLKKCAHYGNKPRNEVGFLLGDYTQLYQQQIFQKLSVFNASQVVPVLSKAVWRNSAFIFNFPWKTTKKYFRQAVKDVISNTVTANNQQLLLHLEYILAVYRLRQQGNRDINWYLSLNNPLLRELRQKVESLINNHVVDTSKSRLKLDVKQGLEYDKYKIPDFLYALLVYINDEAGNDDIRIQKIEER